MVTPGSKQSLRGIPNGIDTNGQQQEFIRHPAAQSSMHPVIIGHGKWADVAATQVRELKQNMPATERGVLSHDPELVPNVKRGRSPGQGPRSLQGVGERRESRKTSSPPGQHAQPYNQNQ